MTKSGSGAKSTILLDSDILADVSEVIVLNIFRMDVMDPNVHV